MMPGGKTEGKPSKGKVVGAFKKGGKVKGKGYSMGGGVNSGRSMVGRQNKSGW